MPKKTKRINSKVPPKDIISEKKLEKSSSTSYTYFILGIIAVLIIGFIIMTFAKGNRFLQTSSTKTQEEQTSSTYTVKPGDDLWTISENIYNDGFKWAEIAKLNKIKNPNMIYSGDKLVIPTLSPTPSKEANEEIVNLKTEVKNNSIEGNSYAIVSGDNLWNIAVRAYGDGFRWPEIARANDLANPNLIHSDNILKIPR